MASSKALVSLADVKAFLPVRAGNTSFDDRLRSHIRVATSQIERALSRRLTRQRHTQYFRTVDTRSATLSLFGGDDTGVTVTSRSLRYVLAGMPVFIDDANPFVVSYFDELVPVDNYVIDTDNGILRTSYGFAQTVNGLKVEHTAGYPVLTADGEEYLDLTDAPDIKQAAITQVLALFKRHTAENAGMDGEQAEGKNPGGQFTGQGGLVPEASALLRPYKVPLLGLS